jgi:hypothetical protein
VGFAKCVEKCCQLLLDPNASHQWLEQIDFEFCQRMVWKKMNIQMKFLAASRATHLNCLTHCSNPPIDKTSLKHLK